jgi:hypothetical protein
MIRMKMSTLSRRPPQQRGQALVLILIFLSLGSLLILPLLGFTTAGLKTTLVYEKKTAELYAADAGVQDAMWQIKYDYLDAMLTNPSYNPFDFTTPFTYSLPDNVNANGVSVTVQNYWIPKDIATPSAALAAGIVEAEKLIVTTSNGTSSYNIKITYYPEGGEDLRVTRLGIWLPHGFSYVSGSSNLEGLTTNTTVEAYKGGQAVLWDFNSLPFNSFPGVNPLGSPKTADVTFRFVSSQPEVEPDTVAWISTSGVADVPFSWNSDCKVYKIASRAGSTAVETYMAKTDTRLLRSGIAGDYRATGNSLMRDVDGEGYYREKLDSSSSATINDIPTDATVRAAYLYWSAWLNGVMFLDTSDNFSNWNNGAAWSIQSGKFGGHYISGGEASKYLTLQHSLDLSSYPPGSVNVMWNQDEGGNLESSDKLYFAFSSDNGSSWSSNFLAFQDDNPSDPFTYTIPGTYLTNGFQIRFYLSGFLESGEYAYLDNITITTTTMSPDTSVVFKIDGQQVFFSSNGTPQQGAGELDASSSQVMNNDLGGYSYVCFKEVTALVKSFSAKAADPAVNHPGNATYLVGSVDGSPAVVQTSEYQLAYAGWSLVIVYSSAESKGHALYLFDTFIHSEGGGTNVDFDNDGQPGGTISGFIVPDAIEGEVNAVNLTVFVGEGDVKYTGDYLQFNGTKLWDSTNTTGNSAGSPNNVWNSKSLGMTADGVDIDTFHVPWTSGLIHTGDTSAQIDVPSSLDQWNLMYIILSIRSEPKTGGNLNYLIR